nr:unnamed protein product [Callosobruchus chinensis]
MENNTCSTDSAKYDKHVHITMDYDSGYMSHNPESNLGSPLESHGESTHVSKPVFLSEDALLERPIITKSDLSFQIDNENYEETRKLFFNVSDDETVLSASVSSGKDSFNALKCSESSGSDRSTEIPVAAPIVVDAKAMLDIDTQSIDNGKCLAKETEHIGTAFTNITNTLATADPQKKLVLVLSKCDKENMYSVKRKYRSLTPESDKCVPSSFDNSFGNNDVPLDETLDTPILTSISMKELRAFSENFQNDKCDTKNESACTVYSDNSMDISLIDRPQNECNDLKTHLFDNPIINTHSIHGDISIEILKDGNENVSKMSMDQNSVSGVICSTEDSVDQEKMLLPTVKCDSKSNVILVDIIKLHSNVDSIASTNSTPKKGYINPLQSCMSPDLFEDEDEPVKPITEVVHPEKQIAEEKYLHKKDYRLIRRVQGTLKGVLPPQSMTVCNKSVDEILNKIESNKNYFFWNNETVINETEKNEEKLNISNESVVAGEPKSLLITGSFEECMKKKFPLIMEERNHGL